MTENLQIYCFNILKYHNVAFLPLQAYKSNNGWGHFDSRCMMLPMEVKKSL